MYVDALRQAGYMRTSQMRLAKLVLIDHDIGKDGQGFRRQVLEASKAGVPVFMYPHAARPMIQWDGMYPVHPDTKCNFVHSEGHAEVMRRYGYPLPICVTGWGYCRTREFQAREKVEKVLFAPTHPNASGWLCEEDLAANKQAFRILLDLHLDLTVRYVGMLEKNGLWFDERVNYHQASPTNAYQEAERHDVVVSYQTYQYLCVARGIPTVGYGEDIQPHSGNHQWDLRWVASWEKYKDIMQFPLDLLKTDNPMQMLREAAFGNKKVSEWRERMIGIPFDAQKFVSVLESYL